MGGYERPSAAAFLPDGEERFERIPPDFNGRLLEDDWDRFEVIALNSRQRVPAMEDVKVTRMINGPEAFTPDNEFCLGETEVRGLFVAAGFCAHGARRRRRHRQGDGGLDRREGSPSLDLWHMDIRRLGRQYHSPSYTLARIRETYESYYDISYPWQERDAGRPLRTSPATLASRARRLVRREVGLGAPSTGTSRTRRTVTRACARAVGRAATGRRRSGPSTPPAGSAWRSSTSPSFAKLEVGGRGAAALLERLCDNRVAREPGRVTYTQMLNGRGGIECDFTVARLEEERFSIVTGTAFGNHDREWIRRHLPGRRVGAGT